MRTSAPKPQRGRSHVLAARLEPATPAWILSAKVTRQSGCTRGGAMRDRFGGWVVTTLACALGCSGDTTPDSREGAGAITQSSSVVYTVKLSAARNPTVCGDFDPLTAHVTADGVPAQ